MGGVGARRRQGKRGGGKTNEKSEVKEKGRGAAGAIDALIGEKEKNEKQKRTKRKKRSGTPTQLLRAIRSGPTTRRDLR